MTTTAAPVTKAVGASHVRVEGRDKVTGVARYSGEVPFADLAHGWLVLSTVARGRVRSVESEPVLAMPGVLAVLHHGNAMPVDADFVMPHLNVKPDPAVALFQSDRVAHVGWPVALVVAETSEQAREAAESLVVHYEQEPHDIAFSADRSDAHPVAGLGGPGLTEKGDMEAELAASTAVVDEEYTTPQEHHNPLEPHATTARWDGGRLEVVDSNQGSVLIADLLAKLFSLDQASVRVRTETVGGGFGSKGAIGVHQVAAVMAATLVQRPVRVVLTRRQMFSLNGYRSRTIQRLRLGADVDGRLRALDHRALSMTSTGYEYVEAASSISRVMYDADAHRTANEVVRLDVPSPQFLRAPGEASGAFALESALDELAEKCGIDPIELRVRNEPDRGPVSGYPFSSRNLVDCFREGARRFGWADRDPRPAIRGDGRWLLGTGTAASSYNVVAAPSTCAVTAEADGTFTVRIAASDIGTGARTAITQLAADALHVAPDQVRVQIGDSDFGPAAPSGASMGTRSWAWAIKAAAEELLKRLHPGATIPPEGVMVRSDTTAAVVALAQQEPKERHTFGAQFAEVAVDPATGEVRVRRMLGVFAAGQIVNPLTARSQFIGGMIWGISMALHEEATLDPATGGLVGADLAGYHFAANADVPAIEAYWVDDPDPDDPVGIKGIGEVGNVGAAAAIANAVWHATGVRHRHLPIRPDRVLTVGAPSA
ncbi:xanthine dehydrogenase family protein molybdopterin-binding subunit [Streptomyces canus]|uniref:xanthine dehydrogenase family protein molybdopterin-binding subunit n=1 Tax=Streptomyces canus TaxID=58343 RepID=UPI00074AA4EE|nr:xanthine dehydrogenase family protein molybdopterin-binding subunit [Streptomyces canus]KUN04345.1 oxidoreductase [Streptomyces canus]